MIKKTIRLAVVFLLLNTALLLVLILFPTISYAHETVVEEVTIHHNESLPDHFIESVQKSLALVKSVEIFDQMPAIDLCVKDGSFYPDMIKKLMGNDVFRAFADKTVMMGELTGLDRMSIWGREVNVTQFLAHAFIHNLQYQHHGFWDANPLGGHAEWKWEGYVEYELLGKGQGLTYFHNKIKHIRGDYDWVELGDGKATVKRHIEYLMLVKYCKEQKGMSYPKLMETEITEAEVLAEMEEFIRLSNR